MKTERGEVVRVQEGRRVILPIAFCVKKAIRKDDLVLIECVEKVEIGVKKKVEG